MRSAHRVMALMLVLSLIVAAEAEPRRRVNPKDGTVMIRLPGATFQMGASSDLGDDDERPCHSVAVRPFYLSATLVTHAQFARFLNERHVDPARADRLLFLRGAGARPSEIFFDRGRFRVTPGHEQHPVNTVTHEGASQYCVWAGMRLPTEAEWEYAARGGLEGKEYPWGDEPPAGRATFGRTWPNGRRPAPTTPVASYPPNGFGLYDMAGNVYQWTSTAYAAYPRKMPTGSGSSAGEPGKGTNRYVLRGGGWHDAPYALRVSYRLAYLPLTRTFFAAQGFRCAVDAVR